MLYINTMCDKCPCDDNVTGWVIAAIIIFMIVLVVLWNKPDCLKELMKSDDKVRSEKPKPDNLKDVKVERNMFTPHGYYMPFNDRRPRLLMTSPGAYGSAYSELMLTCMDSCAGRPDLQDCYKHCKKMHPATWDGPTMLKGFEDTRMVI